MKKNKLALAVDFLQKHEQHDLAQAVQSAGGDSAKADNARDDEEELEINTIEELREIAAKENVDLTGITLKADIVEAIEDHRAK